MMAKNDKPEALKIDDLALQHGWDQSDVDELADIMAQRKDIASREKVLAETKKDLNERASALLLTHGTQQVTASIGTLTFKTMERRTVDNEQLKLSLAGNGVPVDVITFAFDKATRTSVSTSVEFKAAKE